MLTRITSALFIAALAAMIGGGPPCTAQAQAPTAKDDTMTLPIEPALQKLFTDMEAVWRVRDFAPMRGFWAKDLAAPLYLPEEKKDFITTWAQFDAYFKNAAAGSRGGLVTYKPLFAMPLADNMQMVTFDLEWTTHLKSEDAPIGGWVRGFAVVERDDADWKLRAYIEAPLAPIYMRELYKLVAKDRGFKPLP